jgi:hypothetical protein
MEMVFSLLLRISIEYKSAAFDVVKAKVAPVGKLSAHSLQPMTLENTRDRQNGQLTPRTLVRRIHHLHPNELVLGPYDRPLYR